MNTIDEMIEVLQAYKDGKEIEWYEKDQGWRPLGTSSTIVWDFYKYKFRVKPEPRRFVIGINNHGIATVLGPTFTHQAFKEIIHVIEDTQQ